ncbi:hypothetical protein [Gimesia sp.]|uniref:hypothetical protein n=1 Tax=Gimesia sp. TaxID=2024833 RepID=UPI003A8E0B26
MTQTYSELQRYALCLVQSMLGVISSNFRFVSITKKSQSIVVTIVLEKSCEVDLEEIEDCKTEFEALMPGPTDFKFEVSISNERIPWPDSQSTIVVFRRRESH